MPGQNTPIVAPPPPDLVRLLSDNEARVRRRAALAVGRVGLRDGVQPLVAVLGDSDPEVRQMAAFALGLLGDKTARDPLVGALADESPLVQGSAAEALGLIADPAAAEPIGRMVAQIVQGGAVGQPGEDEDARRDTPAWNGAEARRRRPACLRALWIWCCAHRRFTGSAVKKP